MTMLYYEEQEHIEKIKMDLVMLCHDKHFGEALAIANQELQKAESLLGKNHPYVTPYMDMLAEIYELQNLKFKAAVLYKEILKVWERTFVPHYGIKSFLSDIFRYDNKTGLRGKAFNTDRYVIRISDNLHLGTGDNRKCYAFPGDPDKCIKIDKPWNEGFHNTPKKRIKKTLMPWLADFSSNREEARFYRLKARNLGEAFYEHAPRCYGIVLTNLGPGLVFERIRDSDGNYSERLDKFLLKNPEKAHDVMELIERVYDYMVKHDLLLFSSNPDNFVIQQMEKSVDRLVIIDWKTVGRTNNDLPLTQIFPTVAKHKFLKKYKELTKRVRDYNKLSQE